MFDIPDEDYDGEDSDRPYRAKVFTAYGLFILAIFALGCYEAGRKLGYW